MTRPCLDCGALTRGGSRCPACQRKRKHALNHQPAQQARLATTRAQRHGVYQRDGWRCLDCGSETDLTIDHRIPLALEVKNSYRDDELATRCRACNARRGAPIL